MPCMPMTLTYHFKMSHFCRPPGHCFEKSIVKNCWVTLKWQGRPLINIYLISLSVFRKMAGHFNWLYYHNYLTGTFPSWWMTLLIRIRNCCNPWKQSSSSVSLTLSALLRLSFSIHCTSLHLINTLLAFKADIQTHKVMDRHLDFDCLSVVLRFF